MTVVDEANKNLFSLDLCGWVITLIEVAFMSRLG